MNFRTTKKTSSWWETVSQRPLLTIPLQTKLYPVTVLRQAHATGQTCLGAPRGLLRLPIDLYVKVRDGNHISRKYEILLNIFQTRSKELFMSIALYHLPSWIANLIVVKLCLRRQGWNQWHVGLSNLHIYLRQANDPVALPTPSAVPDSQNSSACPQETQRRETPATIIAGVEKNFLMWEFHFCSFCRTKRFLLPSDPTELILRMSNRDAP